MLKVAGITDTRTLEKLWQFRSITPVLRDFVVNKVALFNVGSVLDVFSNILLQLGVCFHVLVLSLLVVHIHFGDLFLLGEEP